MARVSFVSDLHLFAARSTGGDHHRSIVDAAQSSAHFVLGGDIFDFRWSTYPTPEETADAAVRWLSQLAADAPDSQVHFLCGNHDHAEPLLDRLPPLCERTNNLTHQRFYLRIGQAVFLHGDVADRRMSHAELKSRRKQSLHHGRKRRSAIAHRAYGAFVRSGLHRTVPKLAHRPRRTASRILTYLDDIGHGVNDGVREVFFGHTHVPVDGLRHGGVVFHNGGAPIGTTQIPKNAFRILRTDVPDDARVTAH